MKILQFVERVSCIQQIASSHQYIGKVLCVYNISVIYRIIVLFSTPWDRCFVKGEGERRGGRI